MIRTTSILSLFLFISLTSFGQGRNLTATVQSHPSQITIEWEQAENQTSATKRIYKREGEDLFYVSGSSVTEYASVDTPETSFTDTDVEIGKTYEYILTGNETGCITSGIEVDESSDRGILILLYDTTYLHHFKTEFDLYKQDLIGDGWRIKEVPVDRNDTVPYIKDLIVQTYNEDTLNTNTLFIFGHVPVPYSGSQTLDGHSEHSGAWPADPYYADMDGLWTDATVDMWNGTYPWCTNYPEDGKFDQNTIPSKVELSMGRVDFHSLPVFDESEEELLRLYLIKDHEYRHGLISQPKRALIDQQQFSTTNTRINVATLVDPDSVYDAEYLSMYDDGYLFSFASGYGTWWSISGIIDHWDYALDDIQSVFTFSFGSYFGDWDSWDGLLRCALGSGTVLTNAWVGRPGWRYNSMSMGKTIGYCAKRSMNARWSGYTASLYNRSRAMALMGDPTLRMEILAPPSGLIATDIGNQVELVWQASNDEVLGYDIYRQPNGFETYTKVNDQPIQSLNFIDGSLTEAGTYNYMVRAVKLETSRTGSYYNRSQGIFDTTSANVGLIDEPFNSSMQVNMFPNPVKDQLNLKIEQQTAGPISIELMDSYGRLIRNIPAENSTAGHSIRLDVDDLSTGVYTVNVNSEQDVISTKFIKTR